MNSRQLSNPYFSGLRAYAILAKAMQLVKENPFDTEEALKANQARALVWVAVQMLEPEPHPAVHQSLQLSEQSGSMTGPELSVEDRQRLALSLMEKAESLLSGFKPRAKEQDVNFFALSQTPEDPDKALRFAQELIKKTYTGTRYIFLFTDGDGHTSGHGS